MNTNTIHLDQVQLYFSDKNGEPMILVVDGMELEAHIEMVMADKLHEHKPHIVISCGTDTELTHVNLTEDFGDEEDEH